MRKISVSGRKLIQHFEGLSLDAYLDPVGIPTIGYGHTGSEVRLGQRITQVQAEAYFDHDIARFEAAVEELVKVKLTDNEFAALVSFAYNVGEGALAESTLLKKVNFFGAADEFLRWTKADGVELAGLVKRRQAERALFLAPDVPIPSAVPTPPIQPRPVEGVEAPSGHPPIDATKPWWRLICPRDNWRNPVEFPGEAVPAMKALCDRLGLVRTADPTNRKFYADLTKDVPKPDAGASEKGDLTAHFNLSEWNCRDGTPVPVELISNVKKCAEALEKVREKLGGVTLTLTSGYRTESYNAQVGGVPGSEHTKGLAADVWSPELDKEHGTRGMVDRIIAAARQVPEVKGLGVNYDTFVHIDVRNSPTRVEW